MNRKDLPFPVRRFERSDHSRVAEICRNAFKLTSFQSDRRFPGSASREAVWELYGRPALEKERPPCLVALDSGRVSGFLIYGGYSALTRRLGKRIASIVLLAVDPGLQGRGIGRTLLCQAMDLFQRRDAALVTVGTDRTNSGALGLYSSNGFDEVLEWKTWRYHSGPLRTDRSGSPGKAIPHGAGILEMSSFLEDPRFTVPEKRKIRDVLSHRIPSTGADCFTRGRDRAVVERQSGLSSLCGSDYYRVSGIFCGEDGSLEQLLQGVIHGLAGRSDPERGFCAEVFVKTGRERLESALGSAGFIPVHEAVTLHRWI